MMKNFKSFLSLFALILGFYTEGVAQNITSNNGAKLVIGSGSFVVAPGNVSSSGTNTALTNNGTLITEGAVQNASTATISGNGSYKVGGNWENAATFTAGTSTVELTGNTAATVNSGNSNFYNLTLNKGASNPIVNLLTNSARVTNSLNLTGADNKIQLGTLNLTIGNPIVGAASTKYIISDGVGRLIASTVGSSAFSFPIGSSSTSYTPLSISRQSATALSLGVRVHNQVLDNGITGSPLSAVVNKSWVVTEEGTAVSKSLTLTPQWNGTDQLSGFDNAKCGVTRWNSTSSSWDLTPTFAGSRSGTDPYTRTRSSISEVGTFAVGGKTLSTYVQLSAKVFLQGAYAGSSLMKDNLRAAGLVPTSENGTSSADLASIKQTPRPIGFNQIGWGGTETTTASNVYANKTNDPENNIVDWVFIELRSTGGTGGVSYTCAALVQRDGDIVDENGASPLKIYGVPDGNYTVAIKHRNHIAVRSAAAKSLSKATTTVVDFTTNLAEALAPVSTFGHNAMASVAGGKYALWGGNANSDNVVQRTGTSTINDYSVLLSYLGAVSIKPMVYAREDLDLDGTVRKTGSATTNDYTKILGFIGGRPALYQPTF